MTESKKMEGKAPSKRQLAANRQNALKSTGPKTLPGRRRSRWNALKHGLLSEAVVIDDGLGHEHRSEFDRIHRQLSDELHPEGIVEEMLVERIATCYWRLRRAQVAEVGEIRKRLDMARIQPGRDRLDEYDAEKEYMNLPFVRRKMEVNAYIAQDQIEVLTNTIEEIDKTGKFSASMRKPLLEKFGWNPDSWMGFVSGLESMAELGPIEGVDPNEVLPEEKCYEAIKAILSNEKERLEKLHKAIQLRDEWSDDAHAKSCHLPEKEAVDRILRYETTIERQMYRAISQLERLQRRRQGDAVPPPVAMNVNVSGTEA